MDVQDLAPALVTLADVIQFANQKFNGSHANIQVLVNADVEQRCFMIDISLVQSFMDQAKTPLGSDEVKTAKEIAEWVGIMSGSGAGLFGLLKFLRAAKEGATPLQIENRGDGNVTIIGNGNTIVVPRPVFQLAQEPKVVEKAKGVLHPLEKDGSESLAFLDGDEEVFEVTKAEARGIEELPNQPFADVPSENASEIRGQVRIMSAQYEGSAQWGFLWNGRAINAEMVCQAAEWVADFQANKIDAPPNSILDVSMVETAQLDAQGLIVGRATYRVQEVHSVSRPMNQTGLFDV